MKIVGIDPGVTTGISVYDSEVVDLKWRWQFEQLGPEEHHDTLFWFLKNVDPNIIVCEKFDNRGKMAADLIPREYIGVIKASYQASLIAKRPVELVMQSPSQAKGFWTNDKLKACSLWKGTGLKHAMDATRHVLYYLMQTKQLPPEYLATLKDLPPKVG
jgi:hypothetical protein